VGKVLWATNNVLHALSPAFKLLVGVEYSFSWLFWLSFLVWVAVVIIVYRALKEPMQMKWWVSLLISIVVVAIGAQSGIIGKLVLFASPLLDNVWMIWASIIGGCILVYGYSVVMKQIGIKIKEKQKKEDEERREQKAKTTEKVHDIEIAAAGGK
jgi:predicted membrane protein